MLCSIIPIMSKAEQIDVSETDAIAYLDDMLTWWRRRGRPEMRAKARKAQIIVQRMRKEVAA